VLTCHFGNTESSRWRCSLDVPFWGWWPRDMCLGRWIGGFGRTLCRGWEGVGSMSHRCNADCITVDYNFNLILHQVLIPDDLAPPLNAICWLKDPNTGPIILDGECHPILTDSFEHELSILWALVPWNWRPCGWTRDHWSYRYHNCVLKQVIQVILR